MEIKEKHNELHWGNFLSGFQHQKFQAEMVELVKLNL
jgi:hypothetical protein